MKELFCKGNKVWLSEDLFETGAITHHTGVYVYGESELPKGVSASIMVKDCNRTVYLDFDAHTVEQYRKRLDKITLMIDELEGFKMNLMDAAALCADSWREENDDDS